MSEPYRGGPAEISDEEKQTLVTRLREILPEPTLQQGEIDDEHISLLASVLGIPEEEIKLELESKGELGKKFEFLTSRARHALDEGHIGIDWTLYGPEQWKAEVAVHSTPIHTPEGIIVGGLTTYYLKPASAQMRSRTSLFKGSDFVTEDDLRKIFSGEYLAPILEKYRTLVSTDGSRPIDQKEYWDLLAKLDRLGPDTVALEQF